MDCAQHFQTNLRALRQRNCLTAIALSRIIGVSYRTYLSWETKTTAPISKLKVICNVFGVTADDLLTGVL